MAREKGLGQALLRTGSVISNPLRRLVAPFFQFLRLLTKATKEGRARQVVRTELLTWTGRAVVYFLDRVASLKFFRNRLQYEKADFGFFIGTRYFSTDNSGLMSIATKTLHDLYNSKKMASSISTHFSLSLYKRHLFDDIWGNFFGPVENSFSTSTPHIVTRPVLEFRPPWGWWFSDYRRFPFANLSSISSSAFRPAKKIHIIKESLKNRYSLDPHNTVGVHYRGTDKSIEIETPGVESFLSSTHSQLDSLGEKGVVFLMTDDSAAEKAFRSAFADRLVMSQELRVPIGALGAHNVDASDRGEQAEFFLASLFLVSECARVVTHTGNGAFWTCIFRGSTRGVIQIRA